jgi:hypothetical protein
MEKLVGFGKSKDLESEYRARISYFASTLGLGAQTMPYSNLKELLKELDKYGKKLSRAITRRGHHKASGSGKGGVNLHSD